MRPIERGNCQQKFREYQDAKKELIQRLGEYCSYCERYIPAGLAVEHIQPKTKHPDKELNWDNFLLACVNCNSTKGDSDVLLEEYYWPERDNTARAFEYLTGGIVRENPTLSYLEQQRAKKTLDLTGLNKIPNSGNASDGRWLQRREVWEMARRKLEQLQGNDTLLMRESIIELALARGFWSVWMTVFRDDGDMLLRFIAAFPGTCRSCFDHQGKSWPRRGGAI
ncbi:MAG: HNH endonuclease [Gomphosphaeria aponina SAG 52.96 = DSM 107014]|uniref:HNH endonuclease n=1 Tax=Gomphosphaeria aponina SAG 52.96 = DSM 107014 TaxID=1521640 RepID=A0A941GSK1_9CHRO|nr:HNH endonuclease [Gomphosphaeria aponina SAG 52.96 = DSM 107014]